MISGQHWAYEPSKANFEQLPQKISSLCNVGGTRWVYASHRESSVHYLVVASQVEVRSDTNGTLLATEPSSGVVLRVEEKTGFCRPLGAPDVVFFNEGDSVKPSVLRGLALDAVRRYKLDRSAEKHS